jgi:CheY-like chemotaxis protein
MLRTMLELGGHEVYETSDGDSAVELALTLQPDTAIIDIGLPGRDGYVVAAEIRASEVGGRRMRLIALTGYGSEEDRRRAVAAGFDAHLTKPVEPDRLALLLASAGMDCEQEPGDASASVARTTLSRSFVPGGRPIAGGGRSH